MEDHKSLKKLGEFYTPLEIVDYILDGVGYNPNFDIKNKLIFDPSCGDGIFLVEAVKRIIKRYENEGYEVTNPDHAKIILDAIVTNIHGIDINKESCKKTEANLLNSTIGLIHQVKKKFPDYKINFKILSCDSLLPSIFDELRFDFVVGNPPYIRIQRISPESVRERYKNQFQSAIGRFDISILFIEKSISWLKNEGKLGFIVTNKFFTTNYGLGIRNLILDLATIEQIVNLTDIESFQVSVLPCIMIMQKGQMKAERFQYCIAKKYKNDLKSEKISNLFKFIQGNISQNSFNENITVGINGKNVTINLQIFSVDFPDRNDNWFFIPQDECEIAKKISKIKTHTLQNLAKCINVGIKTTANDVFNNPVTEEFVQKNHLERDLVHPSLRGVNINRWDITWTGKKEKTDTYIIYPHQLQNSKVVPVDLDRYPNIKKHFEANRIELESRSYVQEAGRNWYEIWVHQNPQDFNTDLKIVVSDISSRNTFALDNDKFYCLDSCYYILLNDDSENCYKYILGLLNSKLMEFFHKRVLSTHIYSNKYRYMSSFMKNYPIIYLPNGDIGKQIIDVVSKINQIAKEKKSIKMTNELEKKLDQLVFSLYKITKDEQEIINKCLEIA